MEHFTRTPQRTLFLTGCLSLLLTLLVSGCSHADTVPSTNPNTPIATPDGKTYLALERFNTKQGAFELGIAPCTAEGCAFEVRWLEKNKPVAVIALPILAADQATKKQATDLASGADTGLYAWGSRAAWMDDSSVSTVARLVSLDTDTVGLLVTQRFGYEYINQLHRLVVLRDGKLVFLWEFTDGRDYVSSSAVVLPPSGITLLYRQYHYKSSEPDSIRIMRFILNKDKNALVPAPVGVVAMALVAGDFISSAAAYNSREKDVNHCFRSYDVYSSDSITNIPKNHSALVQVFVRREEAVAERQRLIQCGVRLTMSIVDIFSSPTLYQDKE
ncbi:MAG: hypothetical protein HY080_03965 [Gammaproteobacteria bacterium]|nr:hypothetical protein [Gammaproteobacteria bacterium]